MLQSIVGWIRERRNLGELFGLLLAVLAVASLLSLMSYSGDDPSWFTQRPDASATHNWFGRLGAMLAEALLQLFGTTAFLTPLAFGTLSWHLLRRTGASRSGTLATLLLSLVALCDLLFGTIVYGGESFPAGGYLGARLAGLLRATVNTPGAITVSLIAVVASLIRLTRVSVPNLLRGISAAGAAAPRVITSLLARARAAVPGGWRRNEPAGSVAKPPLPRAVSQAPVGGTASQEQVEPVKPPIRLEPDAAPRSAGAARKVVVPAAPARTPRQRSLPLEKASDGFTLPTLDLLNEPEPQSIESEPELLERARMMTDKLREFAVNGSVVAIHPGPVVTTFEFKPEAGVKYSKITGMTDDLSLALKAESVRIDRMPGRATVGIEVPNRRQETIFPRDLFDSDAFRRSASKLTIALGKDIGGHPLCAELEKMPHLLIAGATGSGKSVGLNGMIASILYKASPKEVRMIMIDTKMIELGVYADIPHLLIPVVTNPKLASTALKWAVREMEIRYRQLAAVGVRNILQFNELLEREPGRTMENPKTGEATDLIPLPYIVIVIDELADLMMVSSSDVEESIMRLAQMARAVGIHLIIATQRPSVDVITGTIKANFPSRIAFRVSQRVDSRTIIDRQGAEHLLGRGDMLFLSGGSSRLRRVHGGFITETELARITTFVKKHAGTDYDESVLEDGEDEPGGAEDAERDEMYVRAVETVLQDGKCSITLIQRRLQLGYARAARIVDMMEREGVVSVGEGAKPREILVGPDYLESIQAPQP